MNDAMTTFMEWTTPLTNWLPEAAAPGVSYFVLLGGLLVILFCARAVFNYISEELARRRRVQARIEELKRKRSLRTLSVRDPWMIPGATTKADRTEFTDEEKTIRNQAREAGVYKRHATGEDTLIRNRG